MHKFRVGNKVKYISGVYHDGNSNPLWGGRHGKIEGTITDIENTEWHGNGFNGELMDSHYVKWDSGSSNHYLRKDLELIIPKVELPEELFEL